MRNKMQSYPERFDVHITHNKETKEFKCDENYNFIPKNIFYRAWSYFLDVISICVFTFYFRVIARTKVIGKEKYKKIKKQGGVIVHNHVHFMDAVMITTLITRFRLLRILTLESNFKIPVARLFMKSVGCMPIPVKSFKAHKNFNKQVDELLQNNRWISVAAEGYMWPYYPGLRPFYEGAFKFSVKNNKPVLPIVVLFKKKNEKSNKVRPIVKVLDPIYPNMEIDNRQAIEELGRKTYQVMKKELLEFYPKDTPYLNFVEEELVRK